METREELEEQIRRLTQAVNEMRIRMARLEAPNGTSADGAKPVSSRRRFLTLGAGAALGAVGLAAAKTLPTLAADGATVATGATVTGEHPTIIQGDAATAVPVFAAEAPGATAPSAGTLVGPLQGIGANGSTTTAVDGVDGYALGTQAFGVYGLTDAGVGVTGESSTGVSVYARGSGRILQDPHALAAGVPDYTPANAEMVRDASGALWISRPGGAWQQMFSLQAFPSPRRILHGDATPFVSGTTYGPFDATKTYTGGSTGIPVGAVAAYCAVQSYTPGVLTLFPDGTTDPGIANFSGTGNLGAGLNMLYMLVPLSAAAKFKIHSYITGKCYVDAWGFLM